jgi:probable HAF family extracellular repeat protein
MTDGTPAAHGLRAEGAARTRPQTEGDAAMWWPLTKTGRRRLNRGAQSPCRPAVEVLEGRDVPSYTLTDLGVSPGFVSGSASALNTAGDVVGSETSTDGPTHAFLWHDGVMTDLGTLGGANSYAYGVNGSDQVVGASETGVLDQYGTPIVAAFVWQNGVMTDLGTLGGPYASAGGINDLGQVVGAAYTPDGLAHAFLWQNGTMTDLGVPAGASYSMATGINNAGQVVGQTDAAPFLWQAGTMTPLDPLGLAPSAAVAINDSGQAVGWGGMNTFWGGVYSFPLLWQNGSADTLGGLGGWSGDVPTGINNLGQVVGESDVAGDPDSSPIYHPFLWQSGVMTDLTTQFATGGGPVWVQSINDAGQLAGSWDGHAAILNPVASLPSLAINNVSVTEGSGGTVGATFTVRLSAPSPVPVTVTYATADGTAAAGRDYVAASDTLTFAPGETSKTIVVGVIGDRTDECDETFAVNLSAAANATLAGSGQGVGTILDDDPPPGVAIGDASVVEGDSGYKYMVFTVILSAASEKPITLSYATSDGTAKLSDHDYAARSGTLAFAPGQTTQEIWVAVYGDKKKESNETFFVNLSGATNATFLDAQAVGTILNDDGGK